MATTTTRSTRETTAHSNDTAHNARTAHTRSTSPAPSPEVLLSNATPRRADALRTRSPSSAPKAHLRRRVYHKTCLSRTASNATSLDVATTAGPLSQSPALKARAAVSPLSPEVPANATARIKRTHRRTLLKPRRPISGGAARIGRSTRLSSNSPSPNPATTTTRSPPSAPLTISGGASPDEGGRRRQPARRCRHDDDGPRNLHHNNLSKPFELSHKTRVVERQRRRRHTNASSPEVPLYPCPSPEVPSSN
jgi:hypothetical protein